MGKKKILKNYPDKKKNELGRLFEYVGKNKTTYGYILELPRSHDGSRNRKEVGGFGSVAAALAAKRKMEIATNAASSSARLEIVTLKDFYYKIFIPYMEANKLSASTKRNNSYRYNRAVEYFGEGCVLASLGRGDYERYKIYLVNLKNEKGDPRFKANTINGYLAFMKNIINLASQMELIPSGSFSGKMVPVLGAEVLSYSDEELGAIFAAIEPMGGVIWKYYGITSIMLYSGLRMGEAAALTWDKIDLDNKVMVVDCALKLDLDNSFIIGPTKNKKSRRVPLSDKLISILENYRQWQRINKMKLGADYIGSDYVCVKDDGSLVTQHTVSVLAKFMKARGLSYQAHRFRHTFASRAARAGVAPGVLRDILGHSSITMTYSYYVDIDIESMAAASNLVASVMNFI